MLGWLEKRLPTKNRATGFLQKHKRFRKVFYMAFCDPALSIYGPLREIGILSGPTSQVFSTSFLDTFDDPGRGEALRQWGKDYRVHLREAARNVPIPTSPAIQYVPH